LQHLALTQEFERSLQAVDAALSVPYWDFTYDQYVANASATPMAALWAMDVWADDWFGTARGANHTVTVGRFAWSTIATNLSAATRSPWGYLRAPWNMNKSPYVTRMHDFCGAEFDWSDGDLVSGQLSWPSCKVTY